jgi:hypothetical protein
MQEVMMNTRTTNSHVSVFALSLAGLFALGSLPAAAHGGHAEGDKNLAAAERGYSVWYDDGLYDDPAEMAFARAEQERRGDRFEDFDRRDGRRFDKRRRGMRSFDARIAHGIRTGELTRREVRMIEREQKKLRKMKRRALRDGYVTRKERKRIKRAEKKLSRLITQQKNDRQTRRF